MRVVLVHPPRRYWPYVSEGDNFMLPQALPALAASARLDGHEVRVVDSMPLHLGWRSLAALIERLDPDVVGCGENHALYVDEVLKFFRLCRERIPRAVRIAGGAHFTNLWRRYLGAGADRRGGPVEGAPGDIDAIVIGEGEVTFRALLAALARDPAGPRAALEGGGLADVEGIAFQAGTEVVRTPPRALVTDLDALPLPAYDLVPMHLYGTSRLLYGAGSTTIHHSRGCTSQCTFCAWWTTMADRTYGPDGRARLRPRWRTKSPERTLEEMELLHRRWGRQSFVFVDESWNIDPRFNDAFSDLVIRSRLDPTWFAFLRADCVMRDAGTGVLEKMVRAGLRHVCIGVERAGDEDLASFNKTHYEGGAGGEAIRIFKRRFPEVFLQGTFIVGVRGETPATLRRQADFAADLGIDFPAFHPITPVPGTPVYDEALEKGWVQEGRFEDFDWLTPVLDAEHMTRDEIAEALYAMNRRFANPGWLARGLLSRHRYRRDMYAWFALVSARMAFDVARQRMNPFRVEHYERLVTPPWYDG